MIRQKKAWVRIVEAVVAILLILGFFLTVTITTDSKEKSSKEIYKVESTILKQISESKELYEGKNLREYVLNCKETCNLEYVKDFVRQKLPYSLNFSVRVCDIDINCPVKDEDRPKTATGETNYEKEIFANDIVIADNLTGEKSKKLALFVWFK